MIGLATLGKFWPQAGHGVLSDGGKYGVDTVGQNFNFLSKKPKKKKLLLRKINTNNNKKPIIRLELK